jgi:RNA polymerase sigma-70 factor (ECF subfamily)
LAGFQNAKPPTIEKKGERFGMTGNNLPAAKSDATPENSRSRVSDAQFKRELCALIPFLRAFARTLCGNRDMAEDLAQDALMRAWQSRQSFEAGTNLKAWLFTILRNQFYSECRRNWRKQPWDEKAGERIPDNRDTQSWTMDLADTARALALLPDFQREAVILVAAGGMSYEDAAAICDCSVGTVKSRVSRGRAALVKLLEGDQPLPPPPDVAAAAIMAGLRQYMARSAPAGAAYASAAMS